MCLFGFKSRIYPFTLCGRILTGKLNNLSTKTITRPLFIILSATITPTRHLPSEGIEPSPFLYQRNRLFYTCCKRSSVNLEAGAGVEPADTMLMRHVRRPFSIPAILNDQTKSLLCPIYLQMNKIKFAVIGLLSKLAFQKGFEPSNIHFERVVTIPFCLLGH